MLLPLMAGSSIWGQGIQSILDLVLMMVVFTTLDGERTAAGLVLSCFIVDELAAVTTLSVATELATCACQTILSIWAVSLYQLHLTSMEPNMNQLTGSLGASHMITMFLAQCALFHLSQLSLSFQHALPALEAGPESTMDTTCQVFTIIPRICIQYVLISIQMSSRELNATQMVSCSTSCEWSVVMVYLVAPVPTLLAGLSPVLCAPSDHH